VAGTGQADQIEEAIAAALEESNQGRCDQALRRLTAAQGLESRGRLLAGQCYIRQGLYPEALAELDRARTARDLDSEQMGDVELYRGVALFHLERYTEADAALESASGLTADEAQLSLYRGLIALRRGDPERAAPALESAARLSPAGTEPVASYYAGLAWQGAAERAKARAAFQRVVDIDPDGPWGREAARLLDSTRLFPAYARLSAGIEYDDNVRLRGAGIDIPPSDGGNKDWRGVWSAEAGVQLFAVDQWSGGLFGSYTGSAHRDLDEFDVHYPTLGAWLDRRLGPQTHARAFYSFGYAWVDEDSFLQTQLIQAGLIHTWEKAGTTEVFADVTINGFRFPLDDVPDASVCAGPNPPTNQGCGPNGLDEGDARDRDGVGAGAAIEHRYLVPLPSRVDDFLEELVLRGQYRFAYYDSDGREWDHWSNRFLLGMTAELPLDLRFDAWAAYERRDFDNPSTFPDFQVPGQPYFLSNVDREEDVAEIQTELEKGLGDHFSISARWTYVDNESNRKVYDYNRHIVGGYLNFRFD
jgi:tetratricopeptide (TPR) repeat protein